MIKFVFLISVDLGFVNSNLKYFAEFVEKLSLMLDLILEYLKNLIICMPYL